MKTKILYEDDALFVIHKPVGIAVQSARIGQMDVESELRNYLSVRSKDITNVSRRTSTHNMKTKKPYIGLVHRLDQPVEGLLVVAKTQLAAAGLNRQLSVGSLNKKYLAVVCIEDDHVKASADFIDYMIKEGSVAKIIDVDNKQCVEDACAKSAISDVAKKACLHYDIIHKQEKLALVDIQIETGRFHQIRCQMAHHQMPLLGDVKYGSNTAMELSRKLGIRQTALCADRIAFEHPVSGRVLEFQIKPENVAFSKFL